MYLWQISLAGVSESLIGHLSVYFNVADSLDGTYFAAFSDKLAETSWGEWNSHLHQLQWSLCEFNSPEPTYHAV